MSSDQRFSVVLSSMGRDRAGRGNLRRKSLTLEKSPVAERLHTERRGSFAASVSTASSAVIGTERHERKGSIVHR
jgi:hypothetical protein